MPAYLSMTWGGYVLGNGSAAGDVMNDKPALAAATECLAALASQ